MEHENLERIGEQLRHLGHERREVVERIVSEVKEGDDPEARALYQRLDQISEQCMHLLTEQRTLIQGQLGR